MLQWTLPSKRLCVTTSDRALWRLALLQPPGWQAGVTRVSHHWPRHQQSPCKDAQAQPQMQPMQLLSRTPILQRPRLPWHRCNASCLMLTWRLTWQMLSQHCYRTQPLVKGSQWNGTLAAARRHAGSPPQRHLGRIRLSGEGPAWQGGQRVTKGGLTHVGSKA